MYKWSLSRSKDASKSFTFLKASVNHVQATVRGVQTLPNAPCARLVFTDKYAKTHAKVGVQEHVIRSMATVQMDAQMGITRMKIPQLVSSVLTHAESAVPWHRVPHVILGFTVKPARKGVHNSVQVDSVINEMGHVLTVWMVLIC